MARAGEIERTVQQSVLDRLIDEEPRLAGDPAMTMSDSVLLLKQSLRRDLEWLLNTRRTPQATPDACDEVRQSLWRYGLPDVSSLHRDAPDTASRLALEVEEAIELFEPRLAGARVSLAEQEEGGERRIHFVIEAMLRMDPTPERVVFDTVLDVTSNEFEVQRMGTTAAG